MATSGSAKLYVFSPIFNGFFYKGTQHFAAHWHGSCAPQATEVDACVMRTPAAEI